MVTKQPPEQNSTVSPPASASSVVAAALGDDECVRLAVAIDSARRDEPDTPAARIKSGGQR